MKLRTSLFVALCVVAGTALTGGQGPARPSLDLKGIELRSIGPTLTTGRIQDIEIDPRNPSVWYVASAFGGLWKTENRGVTFTPIFDSGVSFTLCCVVVDPKDSNVVWPGKQIRKIELDKNAGLRRAAWNLRTEPPPAPAGGRGAPQGTPVPPGTYRAALNRIAGDRTTQLGPSQTFSVVQIPQ